jgi:Ca-activated chloride channel homolog
MMIGNQELAHTWCLLGFGLVFWLAIRQYYQKRGPKSDAIAMTHMGGPNLPKSWRVKVRPYLPLLKIGAMVCLIIALARPRIPLVDEDIKNQGIDIMLAIDVSLSMLARDFEPDRLSVSKKVAAEFVKRRIQDRIGLVVFSGESFAQCPLTIDYTVLTQFIEEIQIGLLTDGTAIGMGLASSVNRLKDSDTKSKIIILLTDGVNNAGYIDPSTAIELAKEYGIKVYTIGVGSTGFAEMPAGKNFNGDLVFRTVEVKIDEELLQNIATSTGGQYFRAVDENSLMNIYAEIDRLEKSDIDTAVLRQYKDMFRPWLIAAAALISLWWILQLTIFRSALR